MSTPTDDYMQRDHLAKDVSFYAQLEAAAQLLDQLELTAARDGKAFEWSAAETVRRANAMLSKQAKSFSESVAGTYRD